VLKKLWRWRLFLYQISQVDFRRRQTFWSVAVMVALLCWHWQLLLATLGGVLVMQAIYFFPRGNWRGLLNYCKYLQNNSNNQFNLAVVGGGIASLVFYLLSYILVETDNPWLVTGIIWQSLLSLLTFILLVWQLLQKNPHQYLTKWEKCLNDLTSTEPLKRLIAVRELTNLAKIKQLNSTQLAQLREYFQLMLSGETEPLICQAILTSLETVIDVNRNIPLQIPLKFKLGNFYVQQR